MKIKKTVYMRYAIADFLRQGINAVFRKCKIGIILDPKFKSKVIFDTDEAQERIKQLILRKEPALIARFGGNEGQCTAEAIGIRMGLRKNFSKRMLHQMYFNAGVFPAGKKMLLRFGEISEQAARKVDLLGRWRSPGQDYLVEQICDPHMLMTTLENLEPWYSHTPWTEALKGKKVLVIHPFKETIEKQYEKREKLFEDPRILPEFELTVLRAVQTIAGQQDERFGDWEEALNYMFDQAMKIDFDVAIIGCGAYGMPLAAKLKDAGKTAVHLGGATQLLFGIKGARWDRYRAADFYNEHWVRPSEQERPKDASKIEGGCYW